MSDERDLEEADRIEAGWDTAAAGAPLPLRARDSAAVLRARRPIDAEFIDESDTGDAQTVPPTVRETRLMKSFAESARQRQILALRNKPISDADIIDLAGLVAIEIWGRSCSGN